MKKKDKWIKGCKERGEWAELCFMARAKGLGLGVLKPYGESGAYDVAVENGGRILRVQVKSTIYCRRGREYSLNVMGAGRKRYPKGSVDFFAVWVIPIGEWYIIPYEAMGQRLTLHFTPGSKRSKWIKYREAWELLRVLEIQACVDPLMLEEGGEELLPSPSTALRAGPTGLGSLLLVPYPGLTSLRLRSGPALGYRMPPLRGW
jgi:hypothetical protein